MNPPPNIRQIEAFRMVMITGTVTAAAERLRISQPAVSRLLSLLEMRTGLKLFVRSKQRLQPTPEAAQFYREVERAFVGMEKLQRAAWNIKHAATGQLRLASNPIVGLALLPRVIARFRKAHPEVAISLQTRSSVTVLDWISSSNYDLGFASIAPDQSNLESIPYASLPGVCILPRGHRLSAKPSIDVKDLEGEEFISLDPTDGNRVAIDRLFHAADIRRRTTIEAPYAAAVAAMVAQGLGVSVVSPLAALDRPEESILVKPFTPALKFGFTLVFRKDIPLSLTARAFLEAMRAELTELAGAEAVLATL